MYIFLLLYNMYMDYIWNKHLNWIELNKPEWGQSPIGPCKVYRILIIMLAMRQKDLSSVYM